MLAALGAQQGRGASEEVGALGSLPRKTPDAAHMLPQAAAAARALGSGLLSLLPPHAPRRRRRTLLP